MHHSIFKNIGDGGEGWRNKAIQNLKNKAVQEGRDFKEMAMEHSQYLGGEYEYKQKLEERNKRSENNQRIEKKDQMNKKSSDPYQNIVVPKEYQEWSLSKLKAHQMKASMSNDNKLLMIINKELERRTNPPKEEIETDTKKIILPELDLHGRPINLSSKNTSSNMNDELRKMLEEEKLGKGMNDYATIDGKKITKNSNYKHQDDLEDQYDAIDENNNSSSSSKKKRKQQEKPVISQEELVKKKAIDTYNQFEKITENCPRCFETSKSFKDNLVISFSNFCFLSLPPCEPFVEFHCYIVPIHHVPSLLECDEDTITEITNFKKCLIRMFESVGKRPVFLETCKEITKGKHHTFIEVIPLEEGNNFFFFIFLHFF